MLCAPYGPSVTRCNKGFPVSGPSSENYGHKNRSRNVLLTLFRFISRLNDLGSKFWDCQRIFRVEPYLVENLKNNFPSCDGLFQIIIWLYLEYIFRTVSALMTSVPKSTNGSNKRRIKKKRRAKKPGKNNRALYKPMTTLSVIGWWPTITEISYLFQ